MTAAAGTGAGGSAVSLTTADAGPDAATGLVDETLGYLMASSRCVGQAMDTPAAAGLRSRLTEIDDDIHRLCRETRRLRRDLAAKGGG